MKQILSLIIGLASFTVAFSQSDKYQQAMEANIATLDTVHTSEEWDSIGNAFQRIADAEKTQWLPYYYASLSQVMSGYMVNNGQAAMNSDKTDPKADKAEELLSKAEAISKDNSEIYIVKKMIATLRMMADPQSRYQTYGPAAAEALAKAKELNPNNPRVYMLEGQDKFFTPEQFGGSKTEAKALFEEAMKKFDEFKPESSISPKWGLHSTRYLYSQCN
jgi:tetratricopeptide (TPR) repeat protein